MRLPSIRDADRAVVWFVSAAGIAWLARVLLTLGVFRDFVDDTYIYLRYCENFAAGRGLVYNVGEKVIGFTSFLYVGLLSALMTIARGVPGEMLVKGVNLALFAVYCWLLWRFLDSTDRLFRATVILVLFYFPFIDASLNGMETTLFMVVLMASLVAVRRGWHVWAMFLAGVAVVTRPEGLMLLLPVTVAAWFSLPWKRWLAAAMAPLAVIAAFLAPLYAYYGTVLPQSMLAKSSRVTTGNWSGMQTGPLVKSILLAFGMSDTFYLNLPALAQIGFALVFMLGMIVFAIGVARAWRTDTGILVAAAFYLLVVAFYVAGNPIRIFSWYTLPPALCWVLTVCHGAGGILEMLPDARRVATFATAGAAVLCLFSLVALPGRLRTIQDQIDSYGDMARSIRSSYPGAESLMIADIGFVGYTSKLRIIDLAALVSPVSVGEEHGRMLSFQEIVEKSKPDIICLRTSPLEHDTLRESGLWHRSFASDVEKQSFADTFVRVDLGQKGYPFVFVRRDLPAQP